MKLSMLMRRMTRRNDYDGDGDDDDDDNSDEDKDEYQDYDVEDVHKPCKLP